MNLANKLFKGDLVIWIIFMFLCLVSSMEVFSATSTLAYQHANQWAPIMRHGSFLVIGFLVVLVLHHVPCRYFGAGIILFPISLVMLAVTPFIGISANDAHRWLPVFGIPLQPSELAKLSLLILEAFLLSKRGRFSDDQIFKWILVCVFLTCGLILPENFSTAFMLFGVCFLMMFIGQLPLKKLGMLGGSLLLFLILFVGVLKLTPKEFAQAYLPDRLATWQARLERFGDDSANYNAAGTYVVTDENYQVSHAKIAIARGGVLGQLPGHSQQRDFLPQAYSDFIYAIIIEELGFVVGGVGVLFLYLILLVRVGMIARRCENVFMKLLVLGCGLLIVIQALANMAVAVNLIPVTGQPMPLVSRGGTSTVISCVYIGIILSISRFGAHIREKDEEPATVEPVQPAEVSSDGTAIASATHTEDMNHVMSSL